jgi:hypothetical protein
VSDASIRILRWAPVPAGTAAGEVPADGALFAAWPEPPPSGERAWTEFRRCSEVLVAQLRGLGDPRLRTATRFRLGRLIGLAPSPRELVDEIVRAASTPGAACRLEFGDPARAVLEVDGRPLWEVWLSSGDEDALVAMVRGTAQVRPVQRGSLEGPPFAAR